MMGAMSLWHWIIVVAVITLLFGRNVISSTMADIGKGIEQLRHINEDENKED